jgi:hypothetical protein
VVQWTLALSAQAATLEITVPDPLVTALVLECRDGTFKAVVKNGLASLEQVPQDCVVNMIRRSGTLTEAGRWTCTLDACTQEEVDHQPVSDAPGRVNVVLTTDLPAGAALELTCSGGFRSRVEIALNTAVFEGVPSEECTLFFKGGVPAKFRPIRAGTWSCGLSGTTAVCTQR